MANTPIDRPVALVTGASFGVGAEIAIALAQAGYALAITSTQLANAQATLATLNSMKAQVIALELDLKNPEQRIATIQTIRQHYGRLDVLVNNASQTIRALATQINLEQWSNIMDTNVTGTFFLTQEVGKLMIEIGHGGSIINIASLHGILGAKERSAYGISKAALIQMTRMLAIEWADHRIRVNTISPGRMLTDSPARQSTGNNAAYMEKMLAKIPLHQLTNATEVAQTVLYLANLSNGALTGQNIVLDGGLSASS